MNKLWTIVILIGGFVMRRVHSFVNIASFETSKSNHFMRRTQLLSSFSTQSSIGIDEEFIPFPSEDCDGPGIVMICMDALMKNSEPFSNAGLEVCWNFSSDRCRAAQGGSLEKFIEFARNPVFASLINAQSWEIKSIGPVIPGTPNRGAMQTVLIQVLPQKGRPRDFLWTLQRERRPPRQNYWLVHECISKDNAWAQTL